VRERQIAVQRFRALQQQQHRHNLQATIARLKERQAALDQEAQDQIVGVLELERGEQSTAGAISMPDASGPPTNDRS
jgi:hypothetical protein